MERAAELHSLCRLHQAGEARQLFPQRSDSFFGYTALSSLRARKRTVEMFEIYQLEPDAREAEEPQGTRFKFWYSDERFGKVIDAQGRETGHDCLFKEGKSWSGETASERAAAELGALLGIPVARQELAVYLDRRGTVSPKFLALNESLVLGRELLERALPGYAVGENIPRDHTVANVLSVLARARPNPTIARSAAIRTAADQFVGYLLFDAWIGNMDRHHGNWALVSVAGWGDEGRYLAPSFDHGSSLGRELRPELKLEMLDGDEPHQALLNYAAAEKARGRVYRDREDDKPLSPLSAFIEAAAQHPQAAEHWVRQLQSVNPAALDHVFELFPDDWMSDAARRFAVALLDTNRSRIVAAFAP